MVGLRCAAEEISFPCKCPACGRLGRNYRDARFPGITQITELFGKEIAIDLTDLKPKAADNLSLRDMDVTVFYRADSTQIADLCINYADAHQYDGESDSYFRAFRLVYREARRAAYETVAMIDSLTNEYLRHELNLTLQKFAETGANTILVPANMHGFDMIPPTDNLKKPRVSGKE